MIAGAGADVDYGPPVRRGHAAESALGAGEAQENHPARLAGLDGLRGVAILLVVLSHVALGDIVPGGMGVTLFFFISGFIITRLMLDEFRRTGALDIGAFFSRRLIRLTPAFVVYVALSALMYYLLQQPLVWQDILAALFYVANYWSIFVGWHSDGGLLSPFVITWSLAVEWHYYLLFPFVFLATVRRPGLCLAVVAALLAGALAWRLGLALGVGLDDLPRDRIYMATETRLDSILFGALLSLGLAFAPERLRWLQRPGAFWCGVALVLLSLLYRDAVFRETWRYTVQGVAFFLVFLYVVFGRNIFARCLAMPWIVYVGRISYSLYLYHWLVYLVIDWRLAAQPLWLRAGLVLAVSWLAAHLSWRFVEHYGLRLRGLLGAERRVSS